jgi:hypothetical protein
VQTAREPFRRPPIPAVIEIVEPTRYETILNLRTAKAIGLTTAMPREARRSFWFIHGLHLLMANDVAPVVDFDHRDLVFLIHHRDRHW